VENYRRAWQATDDNMPKNTDTHSEYVVFIAFPQRKLLRDRTSILRLNVQCLSCFELCGNSSKGRPSRHHTWYKWNTWHPR